MNKDKTKLTSSIYKATPAEMNRNETQLKTQGFTVKSNMKNSIVVGPPAAGASRERPAKLSRFRGFYSCGNFPMIVKHGPVKNSVAWRRRIETLDFNYYLPLFFDGLVETEHPYVLFATQGIHDMLQHAGPWIVSVIPQLIVPIRNALSTRNRQVMLNTLKALQQLVTCAEGAGKALVPFFRHILPVLNIFKSKKLVTGDAIYYSQGTREIIADVIEETLNLFEEYGGKDAYESIKSMVPTYMSCVRDPHERYIKRMQAIQSQIPTQHTTQRKPARLPPLRRKAADVLDPKCPITTKDLLSATESYYQNSMAKERLRSINLLTRRPPISETNQSNYPSKVTDESSPRYGAETTQSTNQYLEMTRPLTRLPPISKTNQSNYPSTVTYESSPRYGTDILKSIKQYLERTKPPTRLPPIPKTNQSKGTGASSLRHGTETLKSIRQCLQRTKPKPGYPTVKVNLQTPLPPIRPK